MALKGKRRAASEPDLGHAIGRLQVEQLQRKAAHPVHQTANEMIEDAAWMSEMTSDQARRSHDTS